MQKLGGEKINANMAKKLIPILENSLWLNLMSPFCKGKLQCNIKGDS